MSLYYLLMRRYQRGWLQLKCFAVFVPLFVVAFAGSILLKQYFVAGYALFLLLCGWLTWTFAEYMLHRFWMHAKGKYKDRNLYKR